MRMPGGRAYGTRRLLPPTRAEMGGDVPDSLGDGYPRLDRPWGPTEPRGSVYIICIIYQYYKYPVTAIFYGVRIRLGSTTT